MSDDIKDLVRVRDNGRQLWCEGKEELSVICLDGDGAPAQKKVKVDRPNAAEQKAARVNALAEELLEKHVGKYNKIQYKLWAETINCGKHKSKEVPPAGSIWNKTMKPKPKASTDGMDAMATVVANN